MGTESGGSPDWAMLVETRRKELNLTQEQLAQRVVGAGGRATHSAISVWESPEGGRPTHRNFRALLLALEVEEGSALETALEIALARRPARPQVISAQPAV